MAQHGQTGLLLELMREMRGQRESFQEAQRLAAGERKSEHRWRMLFQALVFGLPVLLGIVYFLFFLSSTGFRWGPFGDVVGVVRIEGQISSTDHASADSIVPLLEKAFANPNVKAVVLSIDSPGGAPVEAERIYTAIGSLKRKHPKPVVAVINNLGASAAFLIALHADKIVAGRYSLVGSIGAIMAPWQLDRAIAKYDVSQRVYASGKLKSFLNPFTPVTPEVDLKAQKLVDQMGTYFLEEVKARRGAPPQGGRRRRDRRSVGRPRSKGDRPGGCRRHDRRIRCQHLGCPGLRFRSQQPGSAAARSDHSGRSREFGSAPDDDGCRCPLNADTAVRAACPPTTTRLVG
jgi:protease-4